MKNKLINLGASYGIDIEIYERKNNIASINTLNDELKLFQVENISLYNIKAIKNNQEDARKLVLKKYHKFHYSFFYF